MSIQRSIVDAHPSIVLFSRHGHISAIIRHGLMALSCTKQHIASLEWRTISSQKPGALRCSPAKRKQLNARTVADCRAAAQAEAKRRLQAKSPPPEPPIVLEPLQVPAFYAPVYGKKNLLCSSDRSAACSSSRSCIQWPRFRTLHVM